MITGALLMVMLMLIVQCSVWLQWHIKLVSDD